MSKIALMCGHGKSTDGTWDCGTSYGGNNEAALMLPITKAAVKYLRASGVTVISDADTDNNKNMIADVKWANKEKVSIYVSVHCDWYKAPTGTMPLYVSAKGKALATAINKAVMSGMGIKTRGVTKRTDLYELNYTDMPACIFETGSIKADISKLKNEPDKYGKCIAKGICNYLGIALKDSATPAPAPTKPYEPVTPYTGALPSITVKNGSTGANAKALQTFLNWCINAKLDVDGIIGEKSVAAIKNYQKQYGLDVDGIFGVKSLAKANEIVNAHKPTTPTPAPKETIYRVRKTWADSKSQVGAYKSLANAKKECDKHKGYYVFDENGKAVYPVKTKEDKIMDACKAQAEHMKNAKYGDYSPVTLDHSKKAGTCVTYEGCVLQRLGYLKSGGYIWHNGSGYGTGKVTGVPSTMTVTYMGNKTLTSLKNKLKAGDLVLLDDNKSGKKGSGGHVFFLTGKWSGNDPYIWDFESSKTCAKTGKPRKYSGSRKVLAIVRLK